uniref:Uncharacterized protein n=1 Tax=Gossypium raimondii TaxID=29730 RepID=A0A0D2SIF0_GOSRA|nr:hypothetical protein B456_005G167900 [Gossypium raimondii]
MSLTQIFPSLIPSFFSLVRSLHCSYITVARLDRSVCYCPSLSPASTLSYSSTQLFTLTNCRASITVVPSHRTRFIQPVSVFVANNRSGLGSPTTERVDIKKR